MLLFHASVQKLRKFLTEQNPVFSAEAYFRRQNCISKLLGLVFFGFEFSLQLWDWCKDAKDGDSARPEEENRKISRWTGSTKDQAEVPILASLFLKSE